MWSKRHEVDYGLQRHRRLRALRGPQMMLEDADALDADPILLRSATHHGEPTDITCPVCTTTKLITLNYVFGDQLGQFSGRIKATSELEEMENEYGEFTVRVVEVCTNCGWNYMISTYLLGDGIRRRPPRRQRTVEDIYG
ncbi:MAG: DUF5318 domain-containing protein [Propionicimonas sp.]|jgi:hypothetical protein